MISERPPGCFHRALRRLADRLAECGFSVLRFDLSGSGDSAGGLAEVDVALWAEDVTVALDQLRTRTGSADVWVVGMRLGGTMAVEAAAEDTAVRGLALWDPVVDGVAYWAGEREVHRQMVRHSHVVAGPSPGTEDGEETVGFFWPRRLIEQIAQIRLSEAAAPPASDVLIVETRPENGIDALVTRLQGLGSTVGLKRIDASQLWGWEENLDKVHVPAQVVNAIADWLQSRRARL